MWCPLDMCREDESLLFSFCCLWNVRGLQYLNWITRCIHSTYSSRINLISKNINRKRLKVCCAWKKGCFFIPTATVTLTWQSSTLLTDSGALDKNSQNTDSASARASGHKLLTKIFKTVLTWVQSPAAQHMWIALRIYRITLLFCVFSFRPRVNIKQVNGPPVKWIESPVKQTNAFLLPGPGKLMFLASNSLSNWTAKFSENCPPGSGRAAEFPARWWNVFSSLPLSSLLLV